MVVTTRSRASAESKPRIRNGRKGQKKPYRARKPPSIQPIPPRNRQPLLETDGDVEPCCGDSGSEHSEELIAAPQYKVDVDETAFFGDVEIDQDFISAVPPEVIYDIFEYTILDHDPERARKEHSGEHHFRPKPHALLGFSAMSRHFRALTEDFSRRFLTKHSVFYRFQSDAVLRSQKRRRSARIEASGLRPSRVYRMELVTAIRDRCIQCGYYSSYSAIMFNGVGCHPHCETEAFPGALLNLTDALRDFDLRDYMLLKSRVPGPRAKHNDLPSIPYSTIWTRMGFGNRSGISYRFNRRDVEKIARLVHGDVEAHMSKKRRERFVRLSNKRKAVWIALKLRYHTDGLNAASLGSSRWFHHAKGLARVERRRNEDESVLFLECMHHAAYGDYDDIHARVCAVDPCEDCIERKFLKYVPWLRDYYD